MFHRSGHVVSWKGELRHIKNVQEGKPITRLVHHMATQTIVQLEQA